MNNILATDLALQASWSQLITAPLIPVLSPEIIFIDRYGTPVTEKNHVCSVMDIFFAKLNSYTLMSFINQKTIPIADEITLIFYESVSSRNINDDDDVLLIHTCLVKNNKIVFYEFNNRSDDESIRNSERNCYLSMWPL